MHQTGKCIFCGGAIETHVQLWRHLEEQQQASRAVKQLKGLYQQAINLRYKLPAFQWRGR